MKMKRKNEEENRSVYSSSFFVLATAYNPGMCLLALPMIRMVLDL
ncbi:hypothetical protein [Sellimonas intestinalis]|nr:hypothetical protein [Sellimonas intestinalis]